MMPRTASTLCCFGVTLLSAGCFSTAAVSRDQIEHGADYDICEVVTTAGDSVMLKEVSGRSGIVSDSTVVGVCEDGKVVRIPLSQIQSVRVVYADVGETVLALLGITAGVLVIAGLALVGIR